MIKKIALSSFASVLLLSQVANAEIKLGSFGSLTFNAGYTSNYVWRGIEQNNGNGTAFAGADLSLPAGIYVGTWTASVSAPSDQEFDVYAGIKKSFGPITADIGYIEYRYAGGSKATVNSNFGEFYGKLSFAPNKAPYTINAAYYDEDTKGYKTNDKLVGGDYYEFSATYDFGPVQSLISYGSFDGEKDITTVTLSKVVAEINFSASYIDSGDKTPGTAGAQYGTKNKDFVVLQATKTF